jgi:hypothetical protein
LRLEKGLEEAAEKSWRLANSQFESLERQTDGERAGDIDVDVGADGDEDADMEAMGDISQEEREEEVEEWYEAQSETSDPFGESPSGSAVPWVILHICSSTVQSGRSADSQMSYLSGLDHL